MNVVVIGGGVSGLAAAFEAVKGGHTVTLCEPSEIGGMIATRKVDGFTLEDGPNVLLERAIISELVDELGLRERVMYPAIEPYEQYVWNNGKPHLVPKTVPQFLRSELFSTARKLTVPINLFRRSALRTDKDDESVLSFFSRIIGERSTLAVLDPVLKGIYGGEVTELSARTLFPQLWEAGKRGTSLLGYMRAKGAGGAPKVFTFRGGIQSLTEALWGRVQGVVGVVRSPVVALARQSEGRYLLQCEDGSSLVADRVIVTVAGGRLARIVDGIAPELSRVVGKVEYASLAMAHLAVPDREVDLRKAFGVLFPGGMKDHLLGVMFKSIVFPDVAPQGQQLLSVVVGGAQAKGFRPSDEDLQRVVPSLVREFLGVRAPMRWLGARVWTGAIPQLKVGHYSVIGIIDSFEKSFPGVAVCGVDRGGVGVSDRIGAGISAVRRVVNNG